MSLMILTSKFQILVETVSNMQGLSQGSHCMVLGMGQIYYLNLIFWSSGESQLSNPLRTTQIL